MLEAVVEETGDDAVAVVGVAAAVDVAAVVAADVADVP